MVDLLNVKIENLFLHFRLNGGQGGVDVLCFRNCNICIYGKVLVLFFFPSTGELALLLRLKLVLLLLYPNL